MGRLFLSYLRGDWPKWFMVGVWAPSLAVIVAVLLSLSAARYGGGYDWRYQVMCKLGSAAENPGGRVFWSLALGTVCAMAIPGGGYFRARVRGIAPRLASFSCGALWVGSIAGLIVALDGAPFADLNGIFYKAHESCATVCFAAFCLGSLGFWVAAMRWLRREGRWSAGACALVSLLVAVPFAGAMISQAYLFFVPNTLGWVGPEWAALGVPVYLSFAFWEWLAAAGIYLFLYVMAILLPCSVRRPGTAA